jgi:hypothetical protein
MQLDLTRVDRGEEVFADPRHEREGTRTESQETQREQNPVREALLKNSPVAIPELFEL